MTACPRLVFWTELAGRNPDPRGHDREVVPVGEYRVRITITSVDVIEVSESVVRTVAEIQLGSSETERPFLSGGNGSQNFIVTARVLGRIASHVRRYFAASEIAGRMTGGLTSKASK